MPNTILLVPGLMGTRLKDRMTGRRVWGTLSSVYRRRTLDRLALPLLPAEAPGSLAPDGLLSRLVFSVYTRLMKQFRDRPFTHLEYDWRASHVEAAELLERRLREITGQVDIVAHSSAGIVVDLAETAGRVARIAYVGYPRTGTVSAAKYLLEGIRLAPAGFRFDPAFVFGLPSVFELLPLDGRIFGGSDPDFWDPAAWRAGRWSVFHPRHRRRAERYYGGADLEARLMSHLEQMLRRTRSVRERLAKARLPEGTRARLYVGTGRKTWIGATMRRRGPRFDVTEPGDGTATLRSCREGDVGQLGVISRTRKHRYLLEDPAVLADLRAFLS